MSSRDWTMMTDLDIPSITLDQRFEGVTISSLEHYNYPANPRCPIKVSATRSCTT